MIRCQAHPTKEAWLAARRIGGSDVAAILGLGVSDRANPPSRFSLWAEKTGKASRESSGMETRFLNGHRAEKWLHEDLEQEAQIRLYDPGEWTVYWRDDLPWLTVTPDRFEIAEKAPGGRDFQCWSPEHTLPSHQLYGWFRGPVSFKTVDTMDAKSWGESPSAYALVQLHAEMIVTGLDEGVIAAYVGWGTFKWWRVERRPDLCNLLIEESEKFWKLVERDTPPVLDGSEATKKALTAIHPKDNGETVEIALDPEELEHYDLLCEQYKEIGGAIEKYENEIRSLIGPNTFGIVRTPDGARKFKWAHSHVKAHSVKARDQRVLREVKA
jgi:predicted phage-related endonuclease